MEEEGHLHGSAGTGGRKKARAGSARTGWRKSKSRDRLKEEQSRDRLEEEKSRAEFGWSRGGTTGRPAHGRNTTRSPPRRPLPLSSLISFPPSFFLSIRIELDLALEVPPRVNFEPPVSVSRLPPNFEPHASVSRLPPLFPASRLCLSRPAA